MRIKFTLIFLSILCLSNLINAQKISGELKKWHKITLSVDLPDNDLTENAITFKNHRMDVIFTDPSGGKLRVPGYFAADNNAANSSAKSGKTFNAILRPYMTGNWQYEVLYYTGADVAIKDINQLPAPSKNLKGSIGTITNTNKSIPDLRAKGRLTYKKTGPASERRYLQFAETGEYFFKFGPDSPENLLNYNDFDFDATLNTCGLCPVHKYNPHSNDYKTGDPSFKNGKGKNLIGALNFIQKQGMNSFSMTLYGGDDKNVFPWVNLNSKFSFDVSKLSQWEVIFDHAEKLGLAMHFKLAENENWDKLNANQLRGQYREMVARFGHHLAIEWNISEEFRGAAELAMDRIDFLAAIDPYQNHRVIHTYPGEHDKYDDWLRLGAKITGASIQSSNNSNYNDAYNGKSGILTWVNKSKKNNTPWVVASDEQNPGSTGIFTDKSITTTTVVKEARTIILWKTIISGGQGVMWYGGGEGDFKTENFARFNTLFKWSKYAFDFLKGNTIPYWKMTNNDNLADGNSNHVLAQTGKIYLVYLEKGGNTQLDLNGVTGNFDLRWFDPRNGGTLKTGNITSISGGAKRGLGNPPNAVNQDWVALVTNKNNTATSPTPTTPVNNDCNEKIFEETNGVIAVEAEDFVSQSKIDKREWLVLDKDTKTSPKPDPDESHADSASGGKYIELLPDTRVTHSDPLVNGVSFSNTPGEAAVVDYKVNFKSAGKYFVWVRAYSTGTEDNGIHVGIDGTWPSSGARMQWCTGKNQWTWESKQRTNAEHCGVPKLIFLNVPSAGIHTVSFSMREDGFEIDKFILSKTFKKPLDAGEAVKVSNCTNTPTNPATGDCSTIELNAIADFDKLNINGFSPAYKDNERNAIAINASQHKDKFAATETTFSGNSGVYDVKINTLTEIDGESTYRLRIDGALVGSYKNPETDVDYSVAGKMFSAVKIDKGATIRIEFNSHTNGKIPEDGGTAFSRGRWTSLNFTCSTSDPNSNTIKSAILDPIQDAYLQNGLNNNSDVLKVEKGKRVTYISFDLNNTNKTIDSAELQLTVTGDAGNGTLKVYQADETAWTEAQLNDSNKPTKKTELASVNKNFPLNTTHTFKLNGLINLDVVTLIIEMEDGNDVSFASKENANNKGPQLNIVYNATTLSKFSASIDDSLKISIFPNPTTEKITIGSENLEDLKLIQLFDLNGTLLKTIPKNENKASTSIDLSSYSKGLYLLSLQSSKNKLKIIKVVKE